MPEASKLSSNKRYAESSYEEAVNERDMHKKLFESGGISQYEFNVFERAVESKKKALEEIMQEEEKAKYLFEESKFQTSTDLRGIQGRIAGTLSAIKSLRDKMGMDFIKDNSIISTIENGMVYDIGCTSGDILTEGKKAASLMDMDSLYIEANVNEEFIKDVACGSEVLIIPEADKSRKYKGKVLEISQGAFNINGQTSIPVHIKIEDMDDFLRPNFNVDVNILIPQ